MTHTDLIARLRRMSPSLDMLSCEDVLQAADALSDLQAENQRLRGALASFARPFAEALDVECDFMTPPAPLEDGFEVRALARAVLRSTEASNDD